MKRNHQRPLQEDYSSSSTQNPSSSGRHTMTRGSTKLGSWRFLVYFLILVILWQFLSAFQPDNSTLPPVLSNANLSDDEPVAKPARKVWSPPPPRGPVKTKAPVPYKPIDLG